MNTPNLLQRMGNAIVRFVNRLATPSPHLSDPEDRLRARTLAFTSIGTLVVIILPAILRVTLWNTPQPIRWYVYFTTLAVLAAYSLSRTRRYRWGLYLTILTYSLGSVVISLSTPDLSESTYVLTAAWNLGAIIIAGLLLSRRQFLRVIAVNVFLLSIPSLAGRAPWGWYGDMTLVFLAEAALLFGIAGASQRHAREMAKSEQRFRELLNSTLEALVIHDGVHILAVNPAFERMFRCPEEQAIGRAPMEFVAPEARDAAWEAFLKNFDKPNAIIRSTALRCDGTRFEAEASLGTVTYEGQQALALSVRDISWRLEAEAELRKLSRALEQSAHGIVITDPSGTIEYVNPAFTQMTGYTAEEAVGQTPRILKSGKHPAEFYAELWETIRGGETWQGEIVNQRKDGSLYWEAQSIAPIFDEEGHITHFVAIKQDITERKHNEEQIRKLQRAVEQAAHSVVITDRTGTIEYVNPAFTQVTGYTAEEAIGQNPRILKSGKHPRTFYQHLWNTIQRGEIWHGEFINRRKDGSLYWERASISPVKDDDGHITHFVAVKEDITQQKELEAELQRARDEALEANRLKTQLLGNVSHDMRTPLGGILGYSEMLLEGALGELSSEQRKAILHILQSTQQLIDFTNDLLNQAELESGRLRLHITKFPPHELLKTISATQSIAEAKGVHVHIETDPNLPETIYGDPYWLRQILANLLGNAVKFTEEGHIWVRLLGLEDEHWAIQVEDTGVGIPLEAQKHIFEPFRQVDGSPTRRYKGSGLGLSIVKQLVDLMHGEIRLESEPGKGSKFTVILPCQSTLTEEQAP